MTRTATQNGVEHWEARGEDARTRAEEVDAELAQAVAGRDELARAVAAGVSGALDEAEALESLIARIQVRGRVARAAVEKAAESKAEAEAERAEEERRSERERAEQDRQRAEAHYGELARERHRLEGRAEAEMGVLLKTLEELRDLDGRQRLAARSAGRSRTLGAATLVGELERWLSARLGGPGGYLPLVGPDAYAGASLPEIDPMARS